MYLPYGQCMANYLEVIHKSWILLSWFQEFIRFIALSVRYRVHAHILTIFHGKEEGVAIILNVPVFTYIQCVLALHVYTLITFIV